jgi:hypothetical protein
MKRIIQDDVLFVSILAVFRLVPAGIMPLHGSLDLLCSVPAACHKRAGLIGYKLPAMADHAARHHPA